MLEVDLAYRQLRRSVQIFEKVHNIVWTICGVWSTWWIVISRVVTLGKPNCQSRKSCRNGVGPH